MQLSYKRLRTIAVENAVHQVAAELVDAGRIERADLANLSQLIRTSDPALLNVLTDIRPAEIPELLLPGRSRHKIEAWLRDFALDQDVSQDMFLHGLNTGIVLAECTNFFDGNSGLSEHRISNVWFGSETPINHEATLPNNITGYTSRYSECGQNAPAIGLSHRMSMEHHGAHIEWLVLNCNIANALGFYPDAKKQFGWTDGKDWIWTIRWMDGSPLVNPRRGHQADGWILTSTIGVKQKLQDVFGDLTRFCNIVRHERAGTLPPTAKSWSEAFDGSEIE